MDLKVHRKHRNIPPAFVAGGICTEEVSQNWDLKQYALLEKVERIRDSTDSHKLRDPAQYFLTLRYQVA